MIHKPPFTITSHILTLIEHIQRRVGMLTSIKRDMPSKDESTIFIIFSLEQILGALNTYYSLSDKQVKNAATRLFICTKTFCNKHLFQKGLYAPPSRNWSSYSKPRFRQWCQKRPSNKNWTSKNDSISVSKQTLS